HPRLHSFPPRRSSDLLVLWNPSSRPRSGIMTAEVSFFRRDVLVGAPAGRKPAVGKGHEPFALVAPPGEIVAVQELAVRPGRERRDRKSTRLNSSHRTI